MFPALSTYCAQAAPTLTSSVRVFFTSYSEIISNLQKNCKSSTNKSLPPLTQTPIRIFTTFVSLFYFPLNHLSVSCRHDAPKPLNTEVFFFQECGYSLT